MRLVNQTVIDLQMNLKMSQDCSRELRAECDTLRKERDLAVEVVEEVRNQNYKLLAKTEAAQREMQAERRRCVAIARDHVFENHPADCEGCDTAREIAKKIEKEPLT